MSLPSSSSSASSSSSSRGQPALHRGLACLICRKRKIRCDAVKPNCTACQKLISNWRPETGVPKPVCIYDPIPPNALYSSSTLVNDPPSRDETSSLPTYVTPHHSFASSPSSSSSSTSITRPNFQQAPSLNAAPSEPGSQVFPGANPLKRGASDTEGFGEEPRSPLPSRPRSQSQAQSAASYSGTTTASQSVSFDEILEQDSFRSYSNLPRRVNSTSGLALHSQPQLNVDVGVPSAEPPPAPAQLNRFSSSAQPSIIILERLVALFFKYCSIGSIVRKDLYSISHALCGSDIDEALLRAILSVAVLYSSSLEDILGCFWKTDGVEVSLFDAQTVANAHANASRRLVDRYRGDDSVTEEVLPVSLLLSFHGMLCSSIEGDLQDQSELSWAAIAIRRLALYNIPSKVTTSNVVPAISKPATTSNLWRERSTRFWAFFVLDRQFQARKGVPPLLSEQDVSTLLPSMEDQRISPSRRSQSSMSLDSSIFVKTQARDLSWFLLIQTVRLFSMSVDQRLRRREGDGVGISKVSFAAKVSELENQIQILSSQVEEEVPKPFTHLSTIRLLLQASQIVSLESEDRTSLAPPDLGCLQASRTIAEAARSLSPSSLKYLDFFEIHSFWIGARCLTRYLASDMRQLSVSFDEIVEDLKSILACLWKHSPRTRLLTKSLMALYRTIDSETGFLSSPSFWPPESVISSNHQQDKPPQTRTLLQLSQQVDDSELDFLNR